MIASRYQAVFDRLRAERAGALIPFVMLGDPNPTISARVLDRLVDAGADGLELGIPFSDPIADGPVIQAAAGRALDTGTTVAISWDLVGRTRQRWPDLPIGLLLYANLVVRRGLDRFYHEAAEAGVDSILLADVPLAESAPFLAAARGVDIASVLIAPPNASPDTLRAIAATSTGYTYLTARSGVTGEREILEPELGGRIEALRRLNAPPPLVGFGISNTGQVRAAVAAGAAGVIVGSAIVRRLAEVGQTLGSDLGPLGQFVAEMKAATLADPIAAEA